MDQGAIRRSKLLNLGFPFLLLILYLILVPSPSVNKIYIEGNAGFVNEGYAFTILRLTPPSQITRLASVNFAFTIKDLTITPRYAYVITSDGDVHIIDISNPLYPKKLFEFFAPGTPQAVAVSDTTLYIATQTGSVHILNIDKPSSPFEKGSIANLGVVLDVDVIGNLVYIARGDQGLDIYDVSNAADPKGLSHYDPGASIARMTVEKITSTDGKESIRAILIIGEHVVQVVDLTNSQQPVRLNSFDFDGAKIEQALIRENGLFVAQERGGLLISTIKNNEQLEQLANINSPRSTYDVALMDDTVYLATGFEGLQVFDITKLDNIHPLGTGYSRFWNHKFLIGKLTFAFLLVWLAFFSQFVLPVRTLSQRLKIFGRLIIFLLGRHGPAIFVKNGIKEERPGESEKKGPGVVWLDTASAAVIRTATKFKETIGPGVHFTKKGESLAGPVDLHTQVDSLGPFEEDKPFEKKAEEQSDEAYHEVQKRRKMTSALTRDGIEVVPNIRVVFRVDTQPAKGDESGSRFGYRTGISQREKENEKNDKEAIFDAITGEGIDPTAPEETPLHQVAWNQLPGRLAVDVWREYVSKFTLDELFSPMQGPSLKIPLLLAPKAGQRERHEVSNRNDTSHETFQSGIADMLHVINDYIDNFVNWMNGKGARKAEASGDDSVSNESSDIRENTAAQETGLQIINEMVKMRLTQGAVKSLDNTGVPDKGTTYSTEFYLLRKRGLKVLSVSIGNLRFKESVEKYLIDQWTANWYKNAKAERERIERRRRYIEIRAEEEGADEYVHTLARHITLQRPTSIQETLRALLMRTRLTIVRNDKLQARMSTERQDIEDLLQWVEGE